MYVTNQSDNGKDTEQDAALLEAARYLQFEFKGLLMMELSDHQALFVVREIGRLLRQTQKPPESSL